MFIRTVTWNSVIYQVIIVVTLPCTAYDYIIAVCKAASLLTVTGDSVRPPETGVRKKGWGKTIVECDSSGFQRGDLASSLPPTMPAERSSAVCPVCHTTCAKS